MVDFGKEDAFVATASDDGTARVWHARSGRELTRITHDGPVKAVVLDSVSLGSAAWGRAPIGSVWNPEYLIQHACRLLTRQHLTEAEWNQYFPGQRYDRYEGSCPSSQDRICENLLQQDNGSMYQPNDHI